MHCAEGTTQHPPIARIAGVSERYDTMHDDFIAGLRRGEMAADHFTIVANAVARDRTLSNAAKGLFLNMSSHREGFTITEEFLASQCTDGVKKIRSQMAELRTHGYIYRGQRSRYPAGTRSKDGKNIGGALGPYEWFVTDKPDEVAAILTRYAAEQRALNTAGEPTADSNTETAGRDYLPKREVVPTSGNLENSQKGEPSNLPPKTGGSPDQRKHDESPGRNNLPKPTGGFGSSIEEQPQKTNSEEQPGGETPPPGPRRTETAGDVALVVTDQLGLISNPPHARVPDELDTLAQAISDEHPHLDHAECHVLAAEQLAAGDILSQEEAMLAIRRTLAETAGTGTRRRRRTTTTTARPSAPLSSARTA
jgi:hypothetical protein